MVLVIVTKMSVVQLHQRSFLISSFVCRLNDIIVSVNGVTTVNVTHAGAVDALKRAGYTVDMVGCNIYNFDLIIIINIHSYVTDHFSGLDKAIGLLCVTVCLCACTITEVNDF